MLTMYVSTERTATADQHVSAESVYECGVSRVAYECTLPSIGRAGDVLGKNTLIQFLVEDFGWVSEKIKRVPLRFSQLNSRNTCT